MRFVDPVDWYAVIPEVIKCRLVLPEAQAPQPDHNVHEGAHNQWWHTSSAGEARVSRVALGFSGRRKPREVAGAVEILSFDGKGDPVRSRRVRLVTH